MAGSRIKGITVEIGGDTTKLQSALKGVNSEIKNTQSQLKDVEKLLKYDALQREIIETEEYLKKLPGIDCGACGAPTCRCHAEDVVQYGGVLNCVKLEERK